jgi:hypothetical protein
MKRNFKSFLSTILTVTLFNCVQQGMILAQDNSNVKEPPIPVYMISPVHEDSLSPGNEKNTQVNNQLNADIVKKLDTLQQQARTSSAESTIHFIWLYTLVALLGIMNIVLLFSSSHIRKELVQMMRFEHQRMLLAAEPSVISQPIPKILEAPFKQEPPLLQAPVRTRKPRTMKPRVKKEKKS